MIGLVVARFSFTNYLKPSIENAGMDPDDLPEADPTKMSFDGDKAGPKAWKEIWGAGQGIGAVKQILPAKERVEKLISEYEAAKKRLADL